MQYVNSIEELQLMTARRIVRVPRAGQFLPVRGDRNGERVGTLRILGIDPGTRFLGWGLISHGKDKSLKLLDCGCIAPSQKLPLEVRLCAIFSELDEVIRRAKPDAAAIEETFAGVNMKSALAMGEGRGVALLCLARANLKILQISPRSIKQAVTGSGASGKPHVSAMVAAQLGLNKPHASEHVSDALAAAIALARRL